MPIVNIPAKVRFILYLVGAVALLTVSYAVDKAWAGDAEVRYVTGLAALLQLLAAARVDLAESRPVQLEGTVTAETGETADVTATLDTQQPD